MAQLISNDTVNTLNLWQLVEFAKEINFRDPTIDIKDILITFKIPDITAIEKRPEVLVVAATKLIMAENCPINPKKPSLTLILETDPIIDGTLKEITNGK